MATMAEMVWGNWITQAGVDKHIQVEEGTGLVLPPRRHSYPLPVLKLQNLLAQAPRTAQRQGHLYSSRSPKAFN